MNLFFERVEFSNILSFGNNLTKINFKQGLNLITGNNGAGKSSALLDVLSFVLFGQPYRKIKIEELINWNNRRHLRVSCTFVVNQDRYVLVRGIKPKILTLHKNDIPVKILSSNSLNQEEIEKIIGIDHKVFKEIISLSINHNEPFLKLSLPKKRELIEQIFSVDVFSLMQKIVKNEIRQTKTDITLSKNSLSYLESTIKNDNDRIIRLENTEKKFETDKQNELNSVNDEIEKIKTIFNGIREKGSKLSNIVNKIKIGDNKKEEILENKYRSEISECNIDIRNMTKIIHSLDTLAICPTCNSEITKDYKHAEIFKLEKCITNRKSILTKSKDKLEKCSTKISEIQSKNNELLEKKQTLMVYKNRLIDLKSNIDNLNNSKKHIQNRKFEIDINYEKNELKIKKITYKSERRKCDDLNTQLTFKNTAVDALSDKGIKSLVFKEMIPILNYNINKYLKVFGLLVNLKFDKFMNVTIKSMRNGLENTSYYCFSEGEKKKIDISILLSFIAIKKSISAWNCNLLVIDELLDSSIDEEGLSKLLSSVENLITDDNNLGIYIISHRLKDEFYNQFTSLLEISKKTTGFSYIKHLKE